MKSVSIGSTLFALLCVAAAPSFAESLATLGFDRMAGEMLPLDNPDPAKLPETKAKRVAAAAKSARKARKGERRSRGSTPPRKPAKRAPRRK